MLYTLAQFSILSFLISLIVLTLDPQNYVMMSTFMLPVMFVYSVYVMQRINKLSTGQVILRTCLFLILALIGYFGLIMVFYAILFATGTITLEDLKPVKN